VTPPKSNEGESLPTDDITNYKISTFIDGVLIGQYYNGGEWKIHTRSTLGANCRYYSNEKTFAMMFEEAKTADHESKLDISMCYSFILQHPENRIVSSVTSPKIYLVDAYKINDDNSVSNVDMSTIDLRKPNSFTFENWNALSTKLTEWNILYKHNFQGFVMTSENNDRWKVRTSEYKRVRMIRQNTPRRDYIWLTEWSKGHLRQYLKCYPEETEAANNIVNKYKIFSSEVFKIYTDVFKAKSMERKDIPVKYRPFIYALHKNYFEVLKPSGKTVSWSEAREFMNRRDIPLMLFGINYELRRHAETIPIEPASEAHSEISHSVPTMVVEDSTFVHTSETTESVSKETESKTE
jgi:hypothetical protein